MLQIWADHSTLIDDVSPKSASNKPSSCVISVFLDPLEVTHQKPLNNVLLLKVLSATVKQVLGGEVYRIGPKLA